MEYLHYIKLTLKEKINYITNIISTWISRGVTDRTDIVRELSLNSNSDQEVMKITNLVLDQFNIK